MTTITLVLFNTSQVTGHKMRLANTADAAVYSGLVWEARGLNYQAYLNRAMVANQATIGQLVSIMSWMQYLEISARNVDATLGWVPVLKPYTQAFYNGSLQANKYVMHVARPAVAGVDKLITVLSNAQTAVHAAAVVAAGDTVLEVVKRNDPRFEVSWPGGVGMAENLANWNGFTKRYTDLEGQQRQAEVIRNSVDPFTGDRGWHETVASIGRFEVRIVKEGKTELIAETVQDDDGGPSSTEWQWKGKDTLSVHTRYWGCGWSGCGWRYDEIPVGWGGAIYSSTGSEIEECAKDSDWFGGSSCDSHARNRWADRLADTEMQTIEGAYDGIRPYRDLSDLEGDEASKTLRLGIEVILPKNEARTTAGIDGIGSKSDAPVSRSGLGKGLYYYEDRTIGDVYSAVSAGEVYFERPTERTDKHREYASLFNPYWDVRLVNPERERLTVWAARKIADWLGGGGGGSVPGG